MSHPVMFTLWWAFESHIPTVEFSSQFHHKRNSKIMAHYSTTCLWRHFKGSSRSLIILVKNIFLLHYKRSESKLKLVIDLLGSYLAKKPFEIIFLQLSCIVSQPFSFWLNPKSLEISSESCRASWLQAFFICGIVNRFYRVSL